MAPSTQVLNEPRIPDCKAPESARRHAMPGEIDFDLVQKVHNDAARFLLEFLLCSI